MRRAATYPTRPFHSPLGEWGGILLMALAETQQLRLLERLRRAGQQPVTLDQLRAGGIDFPAVVIGELELNGYVIERVYEHDRQIGVRLLEPEAPIHPPYAGAADGAEFRDSHRRSETTAALSVGTAAMAAVPTRSGCEHRCGADTPIESS